MRSAHSARGGRLLHDRLKQLLQREEAGEDQVNLGRKENLIVPLIHGAAEFDYAVGGEKSKRDFRRELGRLMYGMEKLMSKLRPVIHRPAGKIND